MRLSTTTNIFRADENDKYIPVLYSMRKCHALGFKVLDVTVAMSKQKDHPLNSDGWEKWIDEVANEAAKLGIEFAQAHLPFYRVSDPILLDDEERQFFERAKYRSIHACGVLGVKWAVEHVFHSVGDQCFAPKIKEGNLRYFEPFVEAAKKENVGIAFENMIPASPKNCLIRYPVTHWELIDFVDSWKDPSVGICWDFGHANFAYSDQSEPLKSIGRRLKALHVHDNLGSSDMHFAPYLGTINWKIVMKALADIGYEGDLTLELGNFTCGRPEPVQDILAKCAYEIGNYLISLYDEAID